MGRTEIFFSKWPFLKKVYAHVTLHDLIKVYKFTLGENRQLKDAIFVSLKP